METYEEILKRMEETYQQESGYPVEEVSEVGLRLRVLAGELHRLDASLDWLERQAFPQTATGEQLDLHGAQRGVTRREATKATGVVSFSRYLPLSFDLVIPKGTVCATSGEPVVEYATTEEAILKSGDLTIDVPVEAVMAGAAGNAAAGYVTTLVDAPTGINYAANETAITGGQDPEEDQEYRERVLDAYGHSPNGTNADYYRDLALQQEGVTMVKVLPRDGGQGKVTLYLWGEDASPSTETIQAVQDLLNQQREIGVTVTVKAAKKAPMGVMVKLKLPEEVDFQWATEQTQAAIKAFFETRGIGEGFLLTDLTRVVLNTVPAEAVEYPTSMIDEVGLEGYVIRPSNVTVEELT